MMSYIEWMKANWVGAKAVYDGGVYEVMDVDHAGYLLINKPTAFADTTAIDENMVEERYLDF